LQKAGQSHALTFKKWQALSEYASSSYLSNHPSLHIVGELTIDSSEQDNKFVLTNLKLSATETVFQINLLHPQFESKYICTPQCLQLTEYLKQNSEGNTMLTRYFDQYEFELFKLYGEVFTLDEQIKDKRETSPEYFNQYLSWLIKYQKESEDIEAFILYLRNIFSEENYVSFVGQPQQLYSHLFTDNADAEISFPETPILDTVNWSDTPTFDEEYLLVDLNASLESTKSELIRQVGADVSLGDIVCIYADNEFGNVTEIRGKNLGVQLIGKVLSYSDGIHVSAKPGDILNTNVIKTYQPAEGLKFYTTDQLSVCNLET
jgi:hypothetical protein